MRGDGALVGLKLGSTDSQLRIVDPGSGTTSPLSVVPNFNGLKLSCFTADNEIGRLFAVGSSVTGEGLHVFTMESSSGALITAIPLDTTIDAIAVRDVPEPSAATLGATAVGLLARRIRKQSGAS